MTKKTFLWQFKKQKFIYDQIINKEVLNKSFVRSTADHDRNIKIIDDGSIIHDFFFKKKKKNKQKLKWISWHKWKQLQFKKKLKIKNKLKSKKKKLKLYQKKKIKVGTALNLEHMTLKHKFWHRIQLRIPMIRNTKINLFDLRNTITDLNVSKFVNKQQKNLPLKLIKPKKGGFKVRYSVLKGYLPISQYKQSKKIYFEKLKRSSKKWFFAQQKMQKRVDSLNTQDNLSNYFKSFNKINNSLKEKLENINNKKNKKNHNFWNIKSNLWLPFKAKNLIRKSRHLKIKYVKKRQLGRRRKFFFKWKKKDQPKIGPTPKFSKISKIKKIVFICNNSTHNSKSMIRNKALTFFKKEIKVPNIFKFFRKKKWKNKKSNKKKIINTNKNKKKFELERNTNKNKKQSKKIIEKNEPNKNEIKITRYLANYEYKKDKKTT